MDFIFSSRRRSELWNLLQRKEFTDASIGLFISGAQQEIGEWYDEWPIDFSPSTDHQYRLNKLASQIHKLRNELLTLPEGIKYSFWITYLRQSTDSVGSLEKGQQKQDEVILFLAELETAASSERMENARCGAKKRPAADLIRRLAMLYFEVFDKRPSSTPTGVFFEIIKIVESELKITCGKHLIATTIKECQIFFNLDPL